EDRQTAVDLAARLTQPLALYPGDRGRDLLAPFLDQPAGPGQHLRARDRAQVAPAGQRLPCGLDGRVGVRRARLGELAEDVADVGRVHVRACLTALAGRPLAGDVVQQVLGLYGHRASSGSMATRG